MADADLSSRSRPTSRKISGYEDPRGIFIACSLTKADDIALIANKLDLRRLRTIRDFCGGYGRARLHWPGPIKDWTVFDTSTGMRSAGRRLLRKHHVKHTRFVDFDLDNPPTQTRISPGDLSLLLYNSINELKSLDNCFANIARLTENGGFLFIKSIALDKEQAKQTKIITAIPPFIAFDSTVWKGRAISRRPHRTSSVQNVTIEFEQMGSGKKVLYALRRSIWSATEIDSHARRHGFSRLWRSSADGYAMFRKNRPVSINSKNDDG